MAEPCESALVGHWLLDGDNRDTSSCGTPGTDGEAGTPIEIPASPSLAFGRGEFTVCATVQLLGDLTEVPADIVAAWDPAARRGFTLTVGASAGGYNGPSSARHLHFGIDNGTEPGREDCGRPSTTSNFACPLTVFDGSLYVGTNDAKREEEWCRLYRFGGNGRWEDCGRLGNRRTHGVGGMAEFEGALYAATWNIDPVGKAAETGLDHGRVYRYRGGTDWEDCGGPGACSKLTSLASFQGRLYVLGSSDETTAGLLSRCFVYEGDSSWKPCGEWIDHVHSMAVHGGRLCVGGNGAKTYMDAWVDRFRGAEVHAWDGSAWENLGNPLGSSVRCNQVHSLGSFGDALFAGVWPEPMAVRRAGRWEECGPLGDSIETNAIAVYNGALYAGTIPRAELWRYHGGTSWSSVARLYDPPGWRPMVPRTDSRSYWEMKREWSRITSLAVHGGRLYASTGSATGAHADTPADVRGRVFAFEAGASASHDRDLGTGRRTITAVRESRRLVLYIDGRKAAVSPDFPPDRFDLGAGLPLTIGGGPCGTLRGRIRDVRIYRRALAASDIERLFPGVDESPVVISSSPPPRRSSHAPASAAVSPPPRPSDGSYGSLAHILDRYDRTGRADRLRVASRPEYDAWKLRVRALLGNLLGLDRMERCSPCVQETEEDTVDGVRRNRMLIQTEPDVWMPVYVLLPPGVTRGRGFRLPCLIAAHGHDGGGKDATAGRRDLPPVKAAIERARYDYGLSLARQGCIVFCPDARGFGERREVHRQGMRVIADPADRLVASSCSVLARLAVGLGQTVAGMWTWDLMRLVDAIGQRPDCDAARIGCVGLSAGGLQALWLSALDERIACTVISGSFFGYRGSLLEQIRCDCSYVPGLLEHVDVGDIGALVAPRPLLVEVGTQDALAGPRGPANTLEQVEITRAAYRLLGAEERLACHVFDGPHRWDGEKTGAFVARWLGAAG